MKLSLYPHFTLQERGDLVAVTALVAIDRIYDSGSLNNGEHLVGGLVAPWLWAAITGHWWNTGPQTADIQTARSARAYLWMVSGDPRYRLAWLASKDWGEQIWPGLKQPRGEDRKVIEF